MIPYSPIQCPICHNQLVPKHDPEQGFTHLKCTTHIQGLLSHYHLILDPNWNILHFEMLIHNHLLWFVLDSKPDILIIDAYDQAGNFLHNVTHVKKEPAWCLFNDIPNILSWLHPFIIFS